MRRIEFPDWAEVLGQAELSERAKHSFEITIRWYLGFCRRARAEVTVQSARDFVAWTVEEKHPEAWQIEEWKQAIRWFFLAAKEQKCQVEGDPPWLPGHSQRWPEWKVAFLTVIRKRNYSYRTEQSYLVWIERFAQHLGTGDLRSQSTPQITEFQRSRVGRGDRHGQGRER